MKAFISVSLVLFFCAASAFGREAPWQDQLAEMSYLIQHISAINAVNGMNLTPEQAAKLSKLARQIGATGASAPKPRGEFHPGLQEAKDCYLELRGVLLSEKEIPAALVERVKKARLAHAEVVRESLRNESTGQTSCLNCHSEPTANRISTPVLGRETPDALFQEAVTQKSYTRHNVFLAHLEGSYGKRGAAEVHRLAPEVDAILTDAQKAIMQNFTCCLVPPRDLSDPVRAGEVEVSDNSVKALRYCRSVSQDRWSAVRERLVGLELQGRMARSPGLDQPGIEALRRQIEGVLDKARAMTDTEFEMKKAELCAALKPSAAALGPKGKQFMAAYFLLLPGSTEIYSQVIQRANRRKGPLKTAGN